MISLKRETNECLVNNYNPAVLLAWQTNMDVQYVLNAYAMYHVYCLLHHED